MLTVGGMTVWNTLGVVLRGQARGLRGPCRILKRRFLSLLEPICSEMRAGSQLRWMVQMGGWSCQSRSSWWEQKMRRHRRLERLQRTSWGTYRALIKTRMLLYLPSCRLRRLRAASRQQT